MIAVIAAALALAGAPASSRVSCDPSIETYGFTGYAWQGRAVLAARECAGVLVSGMSARERAATARLNDIELGYLQGRGLLVLLHESKHLAGEWNECRAERFARANVGSLIGRFVPARDQTVALRAAAELDARMGRVYHEGCDD